MVGFAWPWALLLGLTAVLPWLRSGQTALAYSSLLALPDDPASKAIDLGLRATGSAALLSLAVAAAGPFVKEQSVERLGTGAHVVLLLDRSSSMNENFSGRYLGGRGSETKSAAARRLLADFVRRREHDLFAMVDFAAAPIYVLPLTADHAAVLAAIDAAGGRGHGITNIAPGLAMALDFFRDQPMTGARIILLVSDGAARIDAETRDYLKQRFHDSQTTLYWIYLRNPRGGRLDDKPANPNESTTPEYFLHNFFQELGVPYRAFEAESPDALQRAIAEVEGLENLPLRYTEKLPRRDLTPFAYALSAVLLIMLLVAKRLEVDTWPE